MSVAARGGRRVSIDASSTGLLLDYGPARFLDLVAEVRPCVLFANAVEAELLELADRPPPEGTVCVIKGGAEPTVVILADGRRLSIPVPQPVRPKDSTGAGDAFAAGYLAAVAQGSDVSAAVLAGHRLAARVLDAPGANFSVEVS